MLDGSVDGLDRILYRFWGSDPIPLRVVQMNPKHYEKFADQQGLYKEKFKPIVKEFFDFFKTNFYTYFKSISLENILVSVRG